jgi:hypothetical protein
MQEELEAERAESKVHLERATAAEAEIGRLMASLIQHEVRGVVWEVCRELHLDVHSAPAVRGVRGG